MGRRLITNGRFSSMFVKDASKDCGRASVARRTALDELTVTVPTRPRQP